MEKFGVYHNSVLVLGSGVSLPSINSRIKRVEGTVMYSWTNEYEAVKNPLFWDREVS